MNPEHARIFNSDFIYAQESPHILANQFEQQIHSHNSSAHLNSSDLHSNPLNVSHPQNHFSGTYYPTHLNSGSIYEPVNYANLSVNDPYNPMDEYAVMHQENRSLSQSSTTNTSPDESCNSFLQNSNISGQMDSTFPNPQHPSFSFAICAAAMACASNNNASSVNNSLTHNSGSVPQFYEQTADQQIKTNSFEGHPVDQPVFYSNSMNQNQSVSYENGELENFAEKFKQRRIKLGVTQADVGRALGKLKISGVGSLSQSTICRFESLTLSHNNMIALKPILQAWLEEAEGQMYNNNNTSGSNNTDILDDNSEDKSITYTMPEMDEPVETYKYTNIPENQLDINYMMQSTVTNQFDPSSFSPDVHQTAFDRKRKRTSITDAEKRSLEAFFSIQPRPSSDKIGQIADKLNLKKNVVRVWFCNQRQKQKRMKFKQTSSNSNASINQSTGNGGVSGANNGANNPGLQVTPERIGHMHPTTCSTMDPEAHPILSPDYSN